MSEINNTETIQKEEIKKYPKNIQKLMSEVKCWRLTGINNKDFYFFNKYKDEVLVIFNQGGNTSLRVDYIDINNIEEYFLPQAISKDKLGLMKEIEREINQVLTKNELSLVFSHHMESGTDGIDCWHDIVIKKNKEINMDILNYVFYLISRLNGICTSFYTEVK